MEPADGASSSGMDGGVDGSSQRSVDGSVGDDTDGDADSGVGPDAGDEPTLPPAVFEVDSDLRAALPAVPDPLGGADRPVGAVDHEGIQAQFVLNELLVADDDPAVAEGIARRWQGEVIETVEIDGAADIHVVRVDPSGAAVSDLETAMTELSDEAYGQYRFSEEAGLELVAVAAQEMASLDVPVAINWLALPFGIPEGQLTEAATGPDGYDPDPFTWPYLTLGGVQDTGVTAAWQTLNLVGVRNRPRVVVIDGGFVDNGDWPEGTSVAGTAGWGAANAASCSGAPCPWHGTSVGQVLGGVPDNGIGVAGVAGPHVAIEPIQFGGGFDIRAIARLLGLALRAPVDGPPAAINLSGGVEVPPFLNVLVNRLLDPLMDHAHRFDVLVVAAAGNAGVDVDRRVRFFGFERSTHVPCETSSVVCVGGFGWNSTRRADGSNYGRDAEADSVDVYAPYEVYVPDISDDGTPADANKRSQGTSYSAPYVSGVIALMKAARPGLSARGLVNCLLGTAHDNGDVHDAGGNQRRVNAFGAVKCALPRGVEFPLLRILTPSGSTSIQGGSEIALQAASMGSDGLPLPIQWSSDLDGNLATVGSGEVFSYRGLSVGTHTLTATVVAADGSRRSSEVTVTVRNSPPSVRILAPLDGDAVREMAPINLRALSSDPDAWPRTGLMDSQITWSVSGSAFTANGHSAVIPGGTLGLGQYTVTVTADDGQATATDSIDLTVAPCTGSCPTVAILAPSGDVVVRSQRLDTDGAVIADVMFEATARDMEDGDLDGRISWRAVNEQGRTSNLCAPINIGSVQTRCDQFTQQLRNPTDDPDGTEYLITASVTDSDGNTATSTPVLVRVEYDLL